MGTDFNLVDLNRYYDPGIITIEEVIEIARRPQPEPASPVPAQRYLYVDGSGALQFADSLQEVPQAYRQDAQPLAE